MAAPSLSSPILNTLTFFAAPCAVPWVPDFFYPPIDQGSPSGPPPAVGPASLSRGAVSPLFPPPSPGPHSQEGASAVRTHFGRLSNAPRHLWLCEALCNGRVASHRRPTSVAASGSSHLAAFARRAPTAGVRAARAVPRQPVLPARPGAVLVGDAQVFPLPVPARAPLLAGKLALLGVLACESVFPSPVFYVGLRLPVFSRVPLLFLTWPAWCILSRLKLSLLSAWH